ncbi:MAG: putative 2OG-Fe(II) oxygenase [Betaproteobacteria bacterium]
MARLTPLQLIDRFVALIPPPRVHRHHYGVLAPNSPLRPAVIVMPVPRAPLLRVRFRGIPRPLRVDRHVRNGSKPAGGSVCNGEVGGVSRDAQATELTAYNTDQVVVAVEIGTLVIFPAWLLHSVDANQSELPRISISFNVMFTEFAKTMGQPLWGKP